jgi:hypothetical protein
MLRVLAVTILVSGLGSAISIWLAQDRIDRQTRAEEPDLAQPLSPEDSRRYTHDVEMYYGKTGLLVDKWRQWWEEMTHGKGLADTIAVASLAVAGGVFYWTTKHGPTNRRAISNTKPGIGDP